MVFYWNLDWHYHVIVCNYFPLSIGCWWGWLLNEIWFLQSLAVKREDQLMHAYRYLSIVGWLIILFYFLPEEAITHRLISDYYSAHDLVLPRTTEKWILAKLQTSILHCKSFTNKLFIMSCSEPALIHLLTTIWSSQLLSPFLVFLPQIAFCQL